MAIKSQLTFAELLRLRHEDTGLTDAECLGLAGFARRVASPKPPPPEPETGGKDPEPPPPDPRPAMASPSVFCVIERIERVGPEAAQVEVTAAPEWPPSSPDIDDVPSVTGFDPELTALKPPQLIAAAEGIALTPASLGEQQLAQWLHSLSRAETPTRSVTIEAAVESGDVLLIEEYSYFTMPWWSDLRAASAILRRHFGSSRLRTHRLLHMDKRTLWGGARWPRPRAGTWVLVLGAFGCAGAQDARWRQTFRAWRDQGVRIAVWSPSDASQGWGEIDGCFAWEPVVAPAADATQKMLTCLSGVQWCSPELLRFWRRYFKGSVEDEGAVWHHPDVWQEPGACGLERHRARYQQGLPRLGRDTLHELREVAAALRPGVSPQTLLEEDAWARELGLDIDEGAFERMLAAEVARGRQSPEDQAYTDAWLRRLAFRQAGNERFWQLNESLRVACEQALRRGAVHGRVELPEGFLTATPAKDVKGVVSVTCAGDRLKLTQGDEATPSGLSWFRFEGADEVSWSQGFRRAVLKPPAEQELSGGGDPFCLSAGMHVVHGKRLAKPPWAIRIEQTAEGVIATLDDDRQVQWCAAGGPHEAFLKGNPGAWIDRDQLHPTFPAPTQGRAPYPTLTEGDGPPDSIMEVKLAGDVPPIRLRWIPPGEFQMGSPPNALGRWDREEQHHVTLTRGFWMMETACPQLLWSALAGENSSHFPGNERPVENVSWDDIQERFLPALNSRVKGLEFRLPTEAEWEYACRAGAPSAFSWGNHLSFDDARFLGYDYVSSALEHDSTKSQVAKRFGSEATDAEWAAWLHVPIEAIAAARQGDKQYFRVREGTVPVTSFRPNRWGLYQMHGNVYEWCADATDLAPYGTDPRVDPPPGDAGGYRVFRGGSWDSFGGPLRSACRDAGHADVRFNLVGFRLVAGPPSDRAGTARGG
ncbi:MAG: formylglycine-generating enzyme family protein, partial [Pseudomonadota bacterium]